MFPTAYAMAFTVNYWAYFGIGRMTSFERLRVGRCEWRVQRTVAGAVIERTKSSLRDQHRWMSYHSPEISVGFRKIDVSNRCNKDHTKRNRGFKCKLSEKLFIVFVKFFLLLLLGVSYYFIVGTRIIEKWIQ